MPTPPPHTHTQNGLLITLEAEDLLLHRIITYLQHTFQGDVVRGLGFVIYKIMVK